MLCFDGITTENGRTTMLIFFLANCWLELFCY